MYTYIMGDVAWIFAWLKDNPVLGLKQKLTNIKNVSVQIILCGLCRPTSSILSANPISSIFHREMPRFPPQLTVLLYMNNHC